MHTLNDKKGATSYQGVGATFGHSSTYTHQFSLA